MLNSFRKRDEKTLTTSHTISIVIPVFKGSQTLEGLVSETISVLSDRQSNSRELVLSEIILVHDCGPDDSDQTMRLLARDYQVVRNVWLSRNFGQHAATLAGIASSRGEWIVTMDEDGQHDPRSIRAMLDSAIDSKADLVYAKPFHRAPHGFFRNATSHLTKRIVLPLLVGRDIDYFSSFRLILGESGRTLSAYANNDVFLDVALSWVVRKSVVQEVEFRREGRDDSGYSSRMLMSHFLRLVVTAGTRPLRIVSLLGILSFVVGILSAAAMVVGKIAYEIDVAGWASLVSIILTVGGLIFLILGVIAEYIGVLVRIAIGRPLYIISSDRREGPLYRE